ncbi:MAG: HEAT repeat domain-containing protein [Anaerolineae bacterium]|nr:HEAT repeat domain-containing protein [Anaerolineae bacterium]
MMNATKDTQKLWESLEQAHQIPSKKYLRGLSGILEEDVQRLSAAWSNLPLDARRTLTTTLGEMAEVDFVLDFSALFYIALQDEDSEVRTAAIQGLEEEEDIRLIPRLIYILQKDISPLTRAAAAQSLGRFVLLGELNKIRPQAFETISNALITCHQTHQEDLEVRRCALESLAYTEHYGVPELIQAGYADTEEKMRISAVFAMGRSANRRWANIVHRELNNINPEMRYEATRACGELELHETTRDLIQLVEDVDSEVQAAALWSLGQIGGELARRTLERYTRDANEALQTAAQEALEELEFNRGDITTFFGPPTEFSGESELSWEEADADIQTWFNVDLDTYEDDDEDTDIRLDDEEEEEEDFA